MIASAVHSVCCPHFQAGLLFMTPGVEKMVHSGSIILSDYLCRHLTCDWGDVDSTDRTANERALSCGGPLLSAYRVDPELTLRFITEAGRLVTTAFLPGECLSPR